MKRKALAGAMLLAASLSSGTAAAQYRLRADAYYGAADPMSGFAMLSTEGRHNGWLDAEAAMWLGGGQKGWGMNNGSGVTGDVMVAMVRAKEPHGYGEARVGRMLISTGAVRPIHIDGGDVIARAPWGTSLEAFGGLPVAYDDGTRLYDWAVGGRLSQRISKYGVVGLSYLHLRQYGSVAFEELGIDAVATPARWLDVAYTSAIDLLRAGGPDAGRTDYRGAPVEQAPTGLTNARISVATRFSIVRLEAFAMERSPSHLLPATSLFAALGDIPSKRLGGTLLLRVAPRLDLFGEGAAESLGGLLGARGMARATLRLDDQGKAAVSIEGRREIVPAQASISSLNTTGYALPDASWWGVRASARVPITKWLAAATELELVKPDTDRGKGTLWPWGLVGVRVRPVPRWEIAGAIEAGSSATAVSQVSGLFRMSYEWASK
jgi:hypothetical protein